MNNYIRNNGDNNNEIIKKCTKIIITGSVGVGKTTIISYLKQLFNNRNIPFITIPEYIDGDGERGKRMLDDYLNNRICAFDFQYYILNFYDRYLNNLIIGENTIMIFERLPEDSVTCFANYANKRGLMSDDQLYKLFKYSQEITQIYNLPSYFQIHNNKDIFISIIKSDDSFDIANQIINKCLSYDYKLYLICLYNTSNECLERIHKRGIESEINSYDIHTIERFNKHYTNLFTLFINNESLRYCEIGKLL